MRAVRCHVGCHGCHAFAAEPPASRPGRFPPRKHVLQWRACFRCVVTGFECSAACPESMAPDLSHVQHAFGVSSSGPGIQQVPRKHGTPEAQSYLEESGTMGAMLSRRSLQHPRPVNSRRESMSCNGGHAFGVSSPGSNVLQRAPKAWHPTSLTCSMLSGCRHRTRDSAGAPKAWHPRSTKAVRKARVPCFRGRASSIRARSIPAAKACLARFDYVSITSVMQPPHRKRVRSYNDPGHAHELTFSCFALTATRSRPLMPLVCGSHGKRSKRLHLHIWAY